MDDLVSGELSAIAHSNRKRDTLCFQWEHGSQSGADEVATLAVFGERRVPLIEHRPYQSPIAELARHTHHRSKTRVEFGAWYRHHQVAEDGPVATDLLRHTSPDQGLGNTSGDVTGAVRHGYAPGLTDLDPRRDGQSGTTEENGDQSEKSEFHDYLQVVWLSEAASSLTD